MNTVEEGLYSNEVFICYEKLMSNTMNMIERSNEHLPDFPILIIHGNRRILPMDEHVCACEAACGISFASP